MSETYRRELKPYEWVLLVLLLLVAFWFRTYQLADVPPGLHHDDIKNVILVERIMDGYWRIYYPENNGDEPLYHWLQALYYWVVGSGYPEVRLLSVWISMVGLAAIYILARRLLGGEVALWTLAWQVVSLWPLFHSRRVIRAITLPPLAALAGYFFVRGLGAGTAPPLSPPRQAHGGEEEKRARAGTAFFSLPRGHPTLWSAGGGSGWGPGWIWGLGGLSLTGSLYTYPGSRVLPVFFLLFVGYLALFHRETLLAHWRGIFTFLLVAAVLAAPLGAYLLTHTEDRMGQINAPWLALKAGDPKPVLQNSLRVLGMFTVIGDPHWRQYVADTPVFGLSGAILFYAGLVLALWRWRRPAYAFLLLWLPLALLPQMLSEGAPNFLRPLLAVTATYCFPSLAAVEWSSWLRRRLERSAWVRVARYGTLALLVAVLGLNAWRTYDGYFIRWARHPDARFAYSTTLLDVSRYLDDSPEIEQVLLSGHFASDLDPEMVDRYLRRTDLEPRWSDVREALVYPAGTTAGATRAPTTLIQPDYFPIDPTLQELFVEDGPLYERHTPEGAFVFAVYRLASQPLTERLALAQGQPVGWSGATVFPDGMPDDWAALEGPISFGGRVDLLGYEVLNESPSAPGDVVTLLTYWRASGPGPASGITFLHLLGPEGAVVTGDDGFGAPPNRWQAGDVVVQAHRLALPGDLAPGAYPVELGWYEPDSGVRWTVDVGGGQVDRLLLVPLEVATKDAPP